MWNKCFLFLYFCPFSAAFDYFDFGQCICIFGRVSQLRSTTIKPIYWNCKIYFSSNLNPPSPPETIFFWWLLAFSNHLAGRSSWRNRWNTGRDRLLVCTGGAAAELCTVHTVEKSAQCTVVQSARWACQPPVEGGSPACAHTRCSQPSPFLPLFKCDLSYRQSCSTKCSPFSSMLLCSPSAVVCGNYLRVCEKSLKPMAKVTNLYKTETIYPALQLKSQI